MFCFIAILFSHLIYLTGLRTINDLIRICSFTFILNGKKYLYKIDVRLLDFWFGFVRHTLTWLLIAM